MVSKLDRIPLAVLRIKIFTMLGVDRTVQCRVGDCDNQARYECPRCATKYCSVLCYRGHSTTCVQAFATEADEALRGVMVSDVDRRKTNDTLRRVLRELDDLSVTSSTTVRVASSDAVNKTADDAGRVAGSDGTAVHDTALGDVLDVLQNLADDDDGASPAVASERETVADVLQEVADELDAGASYEEALARLPREQAAEFLDMVRDGRIGRFVPLWRPWWLQGRVVEVVGEGDEAEYHSALPARPTPEQLTCPVPVARRKGSPQLLSSVVDVVVSYCLMLRVHNGDWRADPAASARFLWQRSGVLNDDARFADMDEALRAWVARCGREEEGAALEAAADAGLVFGGRKDWLNRALWDCCCLLQAAGAQGARKRKVSRGRLKIGFFLSWVLGADDDELVVAARHVGSFVIRQREAKVEIETASRVLKIVESGGKTEVKLR